MTPKALILYGYGINCDEEVQHGFDLTGAKTERVHLNQLISGEKKLTDYQILALPGGFSFGDDLGAGKVLAVKIKYNLQDQLSAFVEKGGLIIGICNGFQALVKLGVLPGTLFANDSGRFEDRWVYLKINQDSPCIFTKGIDRLYLPVRHGEGKYISGDAKLQIVAQYVDEKGELAGYPANPNGSELNIAAVCNDTGRIFGIMPHPDAFLYSQNHPRWTREKISAGAGLKVFQNAVEFVKKL
ncbi:MAG: phosphoribosylformylglycinamidine synthase [Parcubacteria group bacterium Gr01-1014_30]|nr:MAG: phosphoribosylformylglycinamidine synthase [Parcubacteria group bacterium Gr01-1014_30]